MKSDRYRKTFLIPWIFLLIILSSCGGLKKEDKQSYKEDKQSYIDHAKRQAQLDMKAGDFQRAINTYHEVNQKYPAENILQSDYRKTLEWIKMNADRAFARGDFPEAGRAYEILLRNYPSAKQLDQSLTYKRNILIKNIETCRKILFERALYEYRSGNLKQAIFLWQSILIFDPENQEIKKMVEIATVQSRNLERLK